MILILMRKQMWEAVEAGAGGPLESSLLSLYVTDCCVCVLWTLDITTAWMNSATMTCLMPAPRGEWLRATKRVSVLRTHRVTTATTGDLHVLHTHR